LMKACGLVSCTASASKGNGGIVEHIKYINDK